MNITDYLKIKQEKQQKKSGSDKNQFRQRILDTLDQIKEHSEERYQELSDIFKQRYDKMNIQKKILLGFYAQVVNELKTVKAESEAQIDNVIKEVKKAEKKVIKTTKKAATNIKKKADAIAKKTAKKASKKTAKKTTKKTAKKSAKKTAKKATKKTTKKTAKKKTSKK